LKREREKAHQACKVFFEIHDFISFPWDLLDIVLALKEFILTMLVQNFHANFLRGETVQELICRLQVYPRSPYTHRMFMKDYVQNLYSTWTWKHACQE